jgi:hypothetical protein
VESVQVSEFEQLMDEYDIYLRFRNGARGSVVVKVLMLQTGKSRVRYPMR